MIVATKHRKIKFSIAEEWFVIARQLKTEVVRLGPKKTMTEQKFSWTWGKKLFDMLADDRRSDDRQHWLRTVHHGRDMTFNKFLMRQRDAGRIVKDSDGYMIPMFAHMPAVPLYYRTRRFGS